MKRLLWTVAAALAVSAPRTFAQSKTQATPTVSPTYPNRATSAANEPLVEFELMTWPEVKQALESGKTTALVYTGGTEQRGPQDVNGGHTLMGRETVK